LLTKIDMHQVLPAEQAHRAFNMLSRAALLVAKEMWLAAVLAMSTCLPHHWQSLPMAAAA
jgi:hypothetical protein